MPPRPARLLAACLATLLLGGGCGSAKYPPRVELTLLATNDFHGALESNAKDRETGRPIGGAPYLSATIERETATNPEGTLLLDAGDIYQGTALSNLTMGKASIDYMNATGFEAAAIGNHEFDWGVPVLRDRMRQAQFPMLVANMVEKKSGKPPSWARPYTIIERKGVRVAVIGLITVDTPGTTLPENVAPYEFLDPAPVANELIERLIPGKADIAVILCHIGAYSNADGELSGEAIAMGKGIVGEAAIIAGHSHRFIAGEVDGVPIVEAVASGRYLGRIDLVVDREAREVIESEVEVITVFADSIAPDVEVAAMIERYRADVAPILDEVIGEAGVDLVRGRQETPMGNLITDIMRDASGVDIAFQNPGGVRAEIPKGPIRFSDVYAVMPFDNTIVRIELSGMELAQLIEQLAIGSGFIHVSGMHYSVDLSRPEGERVTKLALADGTPILPDTRYPVAINNFMAQGGDELPVIINRSEAKDTGILIRDAMADWIRAETAAGRPITAKVEGRVFITGRS